MGGNRSGDQAHPKESSDPRPLIERLLEKGYPLKLIAHDTGVDIKEVRAIKASKLLPDLLAEHEDSEEEGDDTKLDATQAWLGQTTPSQASPTLREDNPADWRGLTEEDLEEAVLDRSGVIELILSWLNEAGQSADDRDSIGSALNEAQIDASKAIREQGLTPPIRLRRESVLMLHRIALWSLGKRGRGGSSKYRVIKENQSNRAIHI
jgi:hypothetical protein